MGALAMRAAGCAAVLGGVVNGIADYLLRGGPAPTAGADITLEALATVPFEAVFAGSLLGAAAMPVWLLGLWPVHRALEPAGPRRSLVIVLLFGYGIVVSSGYHGTYAFFAGGFRALEAAGPGSVETVAEMVDRFLAHHDALMMVFVVPWVMASIGFVVVVLACRTHYSRWMVVVSPILVPTVMPVVSALPSPFGGWIRPIAGTTIWTSFFLLTTLVVWNLEPHGVLRREAQAGG